MTSTRYTERPDLFPWILTILGIVGTFYIFGLRAWFIGALGAGVLMWWGAIRRITDKDGKIVLVVSIDDGEITPYIIGRARWQNTEKIGRPLGNFVTARGNYVDVLVSYDIQNNVAEYPKGGEFSDLYIASIPTRYKELIETLEETQKENIELTQQRDVSALKIARKNIAKFANKVNSVLSPQENEKRNTETAPNLDDSKETIAEVGDGD